MSSSSFWEFAQSILELPEALITTTCNLKYYSFIADFANTRLLSNTFLSYSRYIYFKLKNILK